MYDAMIEIILIADEDTGSISKVSSSSHLHIHGYDHREIDVVVHFATIDHHDSRLPIYRSMG